jgi:photosystem II stability/assembly factor-like uncharacterized protein
MAARTLGMRPGIRWPYSGPVGTVVAVVLAIAWWLGGPAVGIAAAYPSAQRPLDACDFVTAGTGWAVGADEVVLRTVTGGSLWHRQRSLKPPSASLLDVSFADRRTGWVAGEDGLLLATADSGSTWTARRPLSGATWSAVASPDGRGVVAAGWIDQPSLTGVLLRSADGGNAWAQLAALPDVQLYDVCFADRLRGWAVGTRTTVAAGRQHAEALLVMRTDDGGISWSEVAIVAAGLAPGTTTALHAVTAVGADEVWAAGRSGAQSASRGLLLHSVDGGATWLATTSAAFASFNSLSFAGRMRGWAAGTGAGAAVATTRNAGATWSRQRLPAGARVRAVDFVDARRGWAVGDTSRHKGLVARTRDGGTTWVRVR